MDKPARAGLADGSVGRTTSPASKGKAPRTARGEKTLRKILDAARRCVAEGLGRFEWWVLDWNEPSIDFYKSQGGVMQDEWTKVRVDGEALLKLGAS